jgi:hypothetical protein
MWLVLAFISSFAGFPAPESRPVFQLSAYRLFLAGAHGFPDLANPFAFIGGVLKSAFYRICYKCHRNGTIAKFLR